MSQIEIVLSCFRVWHSCLGTSPDWGGLADLKKEGWLLAVQRTIAWLSGEEPQGVSWSKVAEGFRINADGPEAKTWADLNRQEQLAWEAVIRHLVGLVDFQDDADLNVPDLELTWKEWLEKRLNLKEPQNV